MKGGPTLGSAPGLRWGRWRWPRCCGSRPSAWPSRPLRCLCDARRCEGPHVPVASPPPAGSPQDAAPGSFVAIKVTATLASGETWRSTSYAFGSGSCDVRRRRRIATTPAPVTEYVDATLPETTPTPGSVTVRLYAATATRVLLAHRPSPRSRSERGRQNRSSRPTATPGSRSFWMSLDRSAARAGRNRQ